MRAPYQVLVLPYKTEKSDIKFAIFKRADLNYWQVIAGGGEVGETALQSAGREILEETGLNVKSNLMQLDSVSSLPVEHVIGRFLWGEDVYVIPEYAFGLEVADQEITLSREHSSYKWVSYDEAIEALKWDSNKTALWELNERLKKKTIKKENNAKIKTRLME